MTNPCKSCKHRHLGFFEWLFTGNEFETCRRPGMSVLPDPMRNYCSVERGNYRMLDVCGPDGKYWEVKKT